MMDKGEIIKIPTLKSGNFVLSRKYDHSEIDTLVAVSNTLYESIKDLPILPSQLAKIEKELIRRSIFGTAALEGNPLNEYEVDKIINEQDKSKKLKKSEQEIRNLAEAYDYLKKMDVKVTAPHVDERLIKVLHTFITQKIDYVHNVPGTYRNYSVKVGDPDHGGAYTPPKCLPDIQKLITHLMTWMNSREVIELNPLIRAAMGHYHLGLIHPFGDGNGRTARLFEAVLLKGSGIRYIPTLLSNFYYKRMDDYFWAFSLSIKNRDKDITPFLKLVMEGIVDSLKEIRKNVTLRIRLLVMRDYYVFLRKKRAITERQFDLINLMLDSRKSVSLQDIINVPPFSTLYRNVHERTARRDLERLTGLNLLSAKDNRYNLNIETLG